jgi:hypothetical protein
MLLYPIETVRLLSLLLVAVLTSLLQQTFQVAAKLREGLYIPTPLGKQKTLLRVPSHELTA